MNPEIKPVLAEIEAVLKKHDMAGLIMVANRTHCDFVMAIEPSWSCARLERKPDGMYLRIRSQRADYPNKAAQKKDLELTIGTFVCFLDGMQRLKGNLSQLLIVLAKHMEILGRSDFEGGE